MRISNQLHHFLRMIFCLIAVLQSVFFCAYARSNQEMPINEKTYFISVKSGGKIYVKEKYVHVAKQPCVLILLAPLSVPSVESFDIPGYSVMDYFAKKGFDVWGLDFEGQGQASYPASMMKYPPPRGDTPLTTEKAIPQLDTLVNFIKKQHSVSNFALLGWSWGSIVASNYALQHPERVSHLILVGGMYSFSLPLFTKPYSDKEGKFNPSAPAYELVPWIAIESHWKKMMDGKNLADEKAIQSVKTAYNNLDKNTFIPHTIRRAIGPMKDLYFAWTERPGYDVRRLTSPTLVLYGSQDFFADKGLFSKLTSVKNKKEIVLTEATHWIFYEKKKNVALDKIFKFLSH